MAENRSMQRFKKIKLTQGKYVLVDAEDFEWLSQWKWYYWRTKHARTGYAVRNQKGEEIKGKRSAVRMHRAILPKVKLVDHINGNGLDNRKANLRPATQSQQRTNRPAFKNKKNSKFKGVSFTVWEGYSYWVSRIKKDGKIYYLGTFKTELAAHRAYIKKAKELHGEFARWK